MTVRSFVRKLLGSRDQPGDGRLNQRGLLASDLWVDRPDADRRIDAMARRGEITEAQVDQLRRFIRDGYTTLPIEVPEEVYSDIQRQVDRLWSDKPWDVAYAYHSILKPMALSDEASERRPSCRIADLHAVSAGARALYLNRQIFDLLRLLLGQEPVATQSLYFQFGSQQELHRDPVFVQTQPPSHLVAAWIALEDIHPDSGPLVYLPGSHRLPYYEFSPGEHRFDHQTHGDDELRAMAEFDRRQCAEQGLREEPFTPRRGEVLIWHHSLLHGGSASNDPERTRKSFVVHYSTRDTYHRLKQTVLERVSRGDGSFAERPRIRETEELLVDDGCAGFQSPLRGYRGPAGGTGR